MRRRRSRCRALSTAGRPSCAGRFPTTAGGSGPTPAPSPTPRMPPTIRYSSPTRSRVYLSWREIARVAYADPRRLFRADGTLVPIVELDEDAAGMIAAIEVDEDSRTTRVRMWDKNQALEKALKYLGLYERENTQRSENLSLQVVLVGAVNAAAAQQLADDGHGLAGPRQRSRIGGAVLGSDLRLVARAEAEDETPAGKVGDR